MNRSQSVARAIEALATEQFGVFSRDQALALGATRNTVEHRVESGAWCVVLPRIYRVAVVARSLRQQAMTATLWSAPSGLVSHATAAALWRFEAIAIDGVHITVPGGRSLRSDQVTVHHTNDLLSADIGRRGPIAVTSPLRALIARRDLGRADSGWEVRTEHVLAAAGFHAPTRQYSVCHHGQEIARVDLAYPEARIALEYDSDQWHSGTRQRHRDAAPRNQLRALGWTVIEVTPAQLRDPAALVSAVGAVLAA